MALVIYEKRDKIAYVILNRPEVLNALNTEAIDELGRIWADFRKDPEVLVAIITGAGDKSFTAGLDIKEMSKNLGCEFGEDFWDPSPTGLYLYQLDIGKPIIAAVNGFCLGGGMSLILGCDIRIASENASFGMPEVKLGMATRGIGPLIAKAMPLSLTMEILLTGDHISAQEAYQCGLVSRLVPPAELMPTAEKIARSICENAPLAVRAIKESVRRGIELPFEHANRLGTCLNRAVINSEDYKEGLRAVREKRKPVYKGI